MLRQFVYSSHAKPETFHDDFAEILRCSRRNNPELGITGTLILAGEAPDILFIQAIEGEAHHLNLLIEAICTDTRHHALKILLDHTVPTRTFGDWSMGDMAVPLSRAEVTAI